MYRWHGHPSRPPATFYLKLSDANNFFVFLRLQENSGNQTTKHTNPNHHPVMQLFPFLSYILLFQDPNPNVRAFGGHTVTNSMKPVINALSQLPVSFQGSICDTASYTHYPPANFLISTLFFFF